MKLGVFKNYKVTPENQDDIEKTEQDLVRNLFCVVLCYYVHSVKGGWHQLEETVTFLLMQCEHVRGNLHYLFDPYFYPTNLFFFPTYKPYNDFFFLNKKPYNDFKI